MASPVLVSVNQLRRVFAGRHAVGGISFEVRRGEVLGFLGPNGAGKSTTMRMLAGVLEPSSGQILIDGLDLQRHAKQCKAQLGYLPEYPPLYPDQSVDEYLSFCARLRGLNKRQSADSLDLVKTRCGLDAVGRKLIGQLSKGFQQRVGIAQAIIHSPSLIILDEPTVGLDPIQMRQIRTLIRELGRDYAVILSSHILAEVRSVCDRVQLMTAGELVFCDSVTHLEEAAAEQGAFRASFSHPPIRQRLEQVSGVTGVEEIGDRTFLFTSEASQKTRQNVVSQSVENNWGLYELAAAGDALEELFVRLSDGDTGSQPADID